MGSVVEYRAPAPAVSYVAPAPAVIAAPAPVVEYIAPAPAVTIAAPAPTVLAAQAPAVAYAAPAPAVTYAPTASTLSRIPASVGGFSPAPVVQASPLSVGDIRFLSWQCRFLINSNPTSKGSFLVAARVAYCEQ